ncbi:MAG: RNA pseudouridine synthase [Elusimicrobia bacterium CG08_land_8_20_14_0_20_51_18]|nr:MAG: RNA pseudouridine synthase [Elusimicrobia bacterium CG08_land_8_20_14_0_20_51_18]
MNDQKIPFTGESKRLDSFLKSVYPDYSREFVKKIIHSGAVKVNGKAAKPALELREKDLVEISGAGQDDTGLKLKDMTVYEDKSILVINKPAGLLVHPTDSNWTRDLKSLEIFKDTLAALLHSEMADKYGEGVERLGIIHRLDRETSGVMIIAKTKKAQDDLLVQFRERTVNKTYLGAVHGAIKNDFFTINAPIGRESGDKRLKVWEYGRESLTEIRLLKTNGKYSHLEISPKTGRTNQIRVHLSYIKNPVVGDMIYSKSPFERLMLHAFKTRFTHPETGKTMEFKMEPDKDFKRLVKELLK